MNASAIPTRSSPPGWRRARPAPRARRARSILVAIPTSDNGAPDAGAAEDPVDEPCSSRHRGGRGHRRRRSSAALDRSLRPTVGGAGGAFPVRHRVAAAPRAGASAPPSPCLADRWSDTRRPPLPRYRVRLVHRELTAYTSPTAYWVRPSATRRAWTAAALTTRRRGRRSDGRVRPSLAAEGSSHPGRIRSSPSCLVRGRRCPARRTSRWPAHCPMTTNHRRAASTADVGATRRRPSGRRHRSALQHSLRRSCLVGDRIVRARVWAGPTLDEQRRSKPAPDRRPCSTAPRRPRPRQRPAHGHPRAPRADRSVRERLRPALRELAGLAGGVLGRQPRVRVAVVLERGRLLREPQRMERVDHDRQLLGRLLADRRLGRARVRPVRDARPGGA